MALEKKRTDGGNVANLSDTRPLSGEMASPATLCSIGIPQGCLEIAPPGAVILRSIKKPNLRNEYATSTDQFPERVETVAYKYFARRFDKLLADDSRHIPSHITCSLNGPTADSSDDETKKRDSSSTSIQSIECTQNRRFPLERNVDIYCMGHTSQHTYALNSQKKTLNFHPRKKVRRVIGHGEDKK